MNPSSTAWYAIDVGASQEAREAIEYGLMEAGALGTETDDSHPNVRVTGYFATPPEITKVHDNLFDALRIYNLARFRIGDLELRKVPGRDWLAEWKKSWQPVQVGRFIVAPTWLSEPPAVAGGPFADPIVIRIDPGMAFGTGTHETTRLCLKAIERYFCGGSFLDVGTGTGILAIAAAKMFQKPDREGEPDTIMACDTDVDAISIAKENSRLNEVADRISFRVGSVDERTASADLVCANLTAPVIVELLPQLLSATCGRMVLSGILDSQVESVQSRLIELGVDNFEIDRDGEWVALVI